MDFGKKGDAKKAMKLMWKEGITLKQAWKRVKGKDSKKRKPVSSKKRKSKTLKQSDVQAMAKKAMKLKWKEGITLKQAWKKVNKFGDTVCPNGYEPNLKWVGKTPRGQCVKVCSSGMVRDEVTNRCKKLPITRVMRQVPAGMEINPETGRLRKVCLPGQYRDPVSKRCKNIKQVSRVNAPLPILEPLLIENAMMPSEYRESTYMPPGMAAFGKYGMFRRGSMKRCGFGTCNVCANSK